MPQPADAPPTQDSAAPAVLAIDNIVLNLPLAGIGSRALAAAIDLAIIVLVAIVLSIALTLFLALVGLSGVWIVTALILTQFLLYMGYFAAFEIATRGRTPGKMAVRLRTVGSAGGTPTTGAFLIRNLVRVIDLVVGVPVMAADARSRRLGDFLAGTLVVHEERSEDEIVLAQIPPQWNARQVALVESYLRRAEELEASERSSIGRRLVAMVQRDAPHLLSAETATSIEHEPAAVLRRALLAVSGEG